MALSAATVASSDSACVVESLPLTGAHTASPTILPSDSPIASPTASLTASPTPLPHVERQVPKPRGFFVATPSELSESDLSSDDENEEQEEEEKLRWLEAEMKRLGLTEADLLEDDSKEDEKAKETKGVGREEEEDEEEEKKSRSESETEKSGSSDEDEEEERSSSGRSRRRWVDKFPFEENLFVLSRDYDFRKRVATAKTAVVFQAFDKKSGECVAIKFCDWQSKGKVPKEVRILSELQSHPTIVPLEAWYDLPRTEAHAIVTKWVSNDDPEDYIFGQPAKPKHRKIMKYMRDVLTALAHMHTQGVLYRDLKPSNVMWNDKEGKAVVIDFDVATFWNERQRHHRCLGTDGYIAPEIMACESEDEETDDEEEEEEEEEQAEKEEEDDEGQDEEKEEAEEEKVKNVDHHSNEEPMRERGQKKKHTHEDGAVECKKNKKKGYRRLDAAHLAEKRLARKTSGYDLAADVWSAGMIFAQLVFEVPEATVSDDDSKEKASAEVFTKFAKDCLAQHGLDEKGRPLPKKKIPPKNAYGPSLGYSRNQRLAQKRSQRSTRNRQAETIHKNVPTGCLPLIIRMLQSDPALRPTASACLAHSFFSTEC